MEASVRSIMSRELKTEGGWIRRLADSVGLTGYCLLTHKTQSTPFTRTARLALYKQLKASVVADRNEECELERSANRDTE